MPDDESSSLVQTKATVAEILAALKSQGISDLEALVKAMVDKAKEEKAKEEGEEGGDDSPDTIDILIHEHYLLYHDDTHVVEEPIA
jgi:hypothetical protein